MVKLEVTAGTNINHIRRKINTQEIKTPESPQDNFQTNSNHSTILAKSLGEYQSQLGFLQAYEQNLSKLELAQKALQKPMDRSAFEKQLESMMDLVDNTIYAGESLFGKGVQYGLDLGPLEGIESDEDIQNLGETIIELQKSLNQNFHKTSVALINTLSAMGTQTLSEADRETHAAQLKRIHQLLRDG